MTRLLLVVCIFSCAIRAEIPLPLDSEGLRIVREMTRREGLESTRKQLEHALERARAAHDVRSEAYAQAGIAGIAELSRNPEVAERTLRDAAALAAKVGDRSLLGTTALWFGQESSRGGRAERGLVWAQVAASEFRATGDRRSLARALHLAYRSTALESERRKLLVESLAAARAGGDPVDIAFIEADAGDAQRQAGDFGGAVHTLQRVVMQLEHLDAWSEAGRALTLLSRAYAAHSQYQLALETIRKAEMLLERSGEPHELVTARQEMGNLLSVTGERKQAIAIFEQVYRDIVSYQRMFPSIRARTVGLAHGYLGLGEYKKSVELASQAIATSPARTPLPAYWILSAAYYHLARYQDAADAATRGISRAANTDDVANVPAYRWRALSLDRLGRYEEAARDMLEAARIGDAVRGRLIPEDEWKRMFSDDRQQMVHDAIAVLWRAGKRAEAWQVAEQARARAFLDLMASKDTQTARYAATPLTPPELTAFAVRSGETVISYWAHPEAVYVWLTNPRGESESARVPIPRQQLSALVERARSFRYKPDLEAWRQLHRILIRPISGKLPREGSRMVSLLPHGPLLHVPFAALLGPTGRYLIEDYTLRSAPAAGILAHESGKAQVGRFVLVGAPRNTGLPPLPGAKLEVERVATFAPAGYRVFTGSQAQADRVRLEASGARVLHFATHAIEDAAQPFQSFLALSGSERLTAQTIYDLRLGADLVMLTACRSGSGRVSADGLLGFTRAFLYAGAASVIAPLWDIPDDPTVRLVEEFYRLYKHGISKAHALRGAQIKLLNALRTGKVTVSTPAGVMALPEHPGLWAGFVLQGGR